MRYITIAGFLVCATAAIVFEVRARRRPDELATIDTLLGRVMATRSARIALLLFWWWLGWHFLVGQTV